VRILLLLAIALVGAYVHAGGRLSNEELLLEKRGQILDSQTNLGVEGATVIALWRQDGEGGHGSRSACVLERFATTDREGRYIIPNVSSELDLARRTSRSNPPTVEKGWLDFSWIMLVYMPGYLRESDLQDFAARPLWSEPSLSADKKYFTQAPQTVYFSWSYVPPEVESTTSYVKVKPIRILRNKMTYEQEIVYDDRFVKAVAICSGSDKTAEFKIIRAEIAHKVVNLPCAIEPATTIHGDIVSSYMYLIASDDVSAKLRAAGLYRTFGSPMWGTTTAGTLCEAAASGATR